MNKRLISKIVSYVLLIFLMISSWMYYQFQLRHISAEKQEMQDQFSDKDDQINQLKQQLIDAKVDADINRYQRVTENCSVNFCVFKRQINVNSPDFSYSGYVTVKAYKSPSQESVGSELNTTNITITNPVQYIPEEFLTDGATANINTFYLSQQEKTQLENSSQNSQITVGITFIDKNLYAAYVQPL